MTVDQGFRILLACHDNLIVNTKKPQQVRYTTNTAATVALKLKKLGISDVYAAAILFFGKRAYNLILEAYNSNTLDCNPYDLNLETEDELRSYFQKELFLANKSWFYNDDKYWKPRIAKMSLLDMICFFLVPSETLWEIKKASFTPQTKERKPKALPLDRKENIRLSKIAAQFTDLKKLHVLIEENPEHKEFLTEFAELPYFLLGELNVDRQKAEAAFISDGLLTPDSIESFRQTKSRRFWE